MGLSKWIKGIKRRIENAKIKPDENFEFEKEYFGNTDTIEGFKFIYCNNYTEKLYSSNKSQLSFLSCVITLPRTEKVLDDLIKFTNLYLHNEIADYNTFKYDHLFIQMRQKLVYIYLRGDLLFYKEICNSIHNNIITKYIRNNIFPNELSINTPNEFLDNIYNSITNPNKEIDILFIEDNMECNEFDPVIGLSLYEKCDKIKLDNKNKLCIMLNRRFITYCKLSSLSEDELEYIINNVNHGNKLLKLLHKDIIIKDDDYSYIDEIIEE